MNQRTYQEFLSRLPEEGPLEICRICIQETRPQNLIASNDPECSDIHSSYENFTKQTDMGATDCPYFMCTECINMLRKFGEFQDMLRLSSMFWKKYVKKEPSNNKQPLIKIDEGNMVEQIYFETLPQEADVVFKRCSNELKIENNDSDIELIGMELFNDDFVEMDSNTSVVDLKIENCCDICDKEFSSKRDFQNHSTVHDKGYSCAHCGMSIKSKASIIVHLQQIHSEGVATNPYKSICTKCNLELSSKENLRKHVQQFHGPEDETKCPECMKLFGNLRQLKRHLATHREKPYQCTKCGKNFRYQIFLDKHIATHRAYVCELCGVGVSSNTHLKRHIACVHENKKEKKYRRSIACTLCEVILPKLTEAREHFFAKHTRAAWTEFRSLCCGTCSIRFDSTVIRDAHYSLYQGNHDKSKTRMKERGFRKQIPWSQRKRPHECDICKYTFKTTDSLEKHMKMHPKKPRPFKCEFCGSTHAVLMHLRKHIQRAHTERPFSCTECDYKFVTRREFNHHNSKWHRIDK